MVEFFFFFIFDLYAVLSLYIVCCNKELFFINSVYFILVIIFKFYDVKITYCGHEDKFIWIFINELFNYYFLSFAKFYSEIIKIIIIFLLCTSIILWRIITLYKNL